MIFIVIAHKRTMPSSEKALTDVKIWKPLTIRVFSRKTTWRRKLGDFSGFNSLFFVKGEVRDQNNLSSNERLYNAYFPHKVLNLHVKSKSRNNAIKVYTVCLLMPVFHFIISLAASEIFPQWHNFFQLSTNVSLAKCFSSGERNGEVENGL